MLPLVEELPQSTDAIRVAKKLVHLPGAIFLDSAADPGRYSFLSATPSIWLRSKNGLIRRKARGEPGSRAGEKRQNPFHILLNYLKEEERVTVPGLPPFQGGAAGLFGYELLQHIEKVPLARIDDFQLPDMAVGIYDWVIGFDHQTSRSWLISTGYPERGAQREARAHQRANEVMALLDRAGPSHKALPGGSFRPAVQKPFPGIPGLWSNFTKEEYLEKARKAIEYVHAGDCFQVNLAQRLLLHGVEDPFDLYLRLRERNPAPFSAYLWTGEEAILSSSPERFLKVTDRMVETRPIKGTRPCGTSPVEDMWLREDLRHSEKDQAENVMIVDLLRNDLGRVCQYGSIKVDQLCSMETYRYVHHLVSVVTGSLRPEMTLIDLFQAAFPGGSITGAPKVRAMEIISELEPTVRGPYCGSIGYLGFNGFMDTNLLIRTITVKNGWAQFPVGGGIVSDSQPISEWEETLHKAEGMIRAFR